jgi:hypothetical protein
MGEMNRNLVFQADIGVSEARAHMEMMRKLCLRGGAGRRVLLGRVFVYRLDGCGLVEIEVK